MEKPATLAVIAAGCLWGIINLFVKEMAAAGLSALQISFLRVLVATVILTVFLVLKDRSKFRIALRDIWMFVGTGIISLVLFNTCYFYAMIHGQASVAVVLLYTSPIFVMLMAALLFKERITKLKVAALLMTFAGCICVAGILGSSYALPPIVLAAGLASGFLYALYTIFGRYALAKYDAMTVTVYTFIFALAGQVVVCDARAACAVSFSSMKMILLTLGIGVFSTILPYVLYTWGLAFVESGKAAILVAVEPLVGAVIGMTVFRESHDLIKILGIGLILCAIMMLGRRESKTS
ncbi:MAG: DMT family transporter [Lachnospiraceae bacterium]|nr:DMT family transporter [Lachnospiraceae bacterium]